MEATSVISKPLPRIDAVDKVTGATKYVDDLSQPRMVHGKILRSPHAHARIEGIDTGKAEKLPGVKAVITGQNTSGAKAGGLRRTRDRYPIAMDKVRFIGEAVAAVAAIDEDTAEEALQLIEVHYSPLDAVFDAEEAIKEGAPNIHDHVERNICLEQRWDFGDVEKGFKDSDYVREDEFQTPIVLHGFLEPIGCMAVWEPSNKLTIWTPTQMPFILRGDLSRILGLPQGRIRVITTPPGAAFGGKSSIFDIHVAAALLAKKSGRPAKITYSMKEQFVGGIRRIPVKIKLKTGTKKDGRIVAQSSKIITDGGAYVGVGPVTIYNHGLAHMLPYRVPNFKYEAYRIYTNNPVCGPKRGHGQCQTRFAVDSQLDMIAEDLGLDPLEIRLKNALQPGDTTVNGFRITTCGFSEAVKEAAKKAGWAEKKGIGDGRGIGIGCGGFPSGVRSRALADAGAIVKVNEDGGIILMVGAVDMGQGLDTVCGQIVAEVLGLSLDDITVRSADTETCPYDAGVVGSRGTQFAGSASMMAAEKVRDRIAQTVASRFQTQTDDIAFKNRRVFSKTDPQKTMTFPEAVRAAQVSSEQGIIIGQATYYPPNVEWPNPKRSYAGNIASSYSFSTQVAEVHVDHDTGKVRLLNMTLVDDCGTPLNTLACEGQAEGSASNAQGEVLYEQIFMKNGELLNDNFADYKMPTALDSPRMETGHILTDDPDGPFGAKEVGEGFIISGFGAIANAIHDATGIWVKELPITPEKILNALKEKKKGGQS